MIRHAKKITAATGATVLSLGLAAPALAHTEGSQDTSKPTASHAKAHDVMTVDELRARLTDTIDKRLAWIGTAQSRVAESSRLSDEQKAAVLARLQTAQDSLSALEAGIATAVTTDEIFEAVKASGLRGLLFRAHWRGHHYGWDADGFRDGRVGNADRDDKSRSAHETGDEGRSATSNVSSSRRTTWSSFRHDGDRNRDNRSGSWRRGDCDRHGDDSDRDGRVESFRGERDDRHDSR